MQLKTQRRFESRLEGPRCYVAIALVGSAVIGAVATNRNNNTTTTTTPPPQTDAQAEAERLRLEEMRRQNELMAQMFPLQQQQIAQQQALIQYQLDHQHDLDELHSQQLKLAGIQMQNEIANAAMQQQLQPLQLQALTTQNQLAMEQMNALRETTGYQREQNKYIIAEMQDRARRLEARNKAYSPEEEAQAAAEEARRASRMGVMSEEAANIQLENLKRGNKPTEEQLANINEAIDSSQAQGESDISRFLLETQRQINEETSQAAGLRPTDTPALRLSERAGEEAARQQGQLTSKMAETRATAKLNYPMAANKLEADNAARLFSLTSGASQFSEELRSAAVANRNQAFNLPGSVGFAVPQTGASPNLSFMNSGGPQTNASAFGFNFGNPGSTTTTASGPGVTLGQIGQLTGGVGSFMANYGRLFPTGG